LRVAVELQELGADLVAGHSAHVFHGVGWGERGPLLYDLGDALEPFVAALPAPKLGRFRPGGQQLMGRLEAS
ncbi:CapA family protein, partial [Salmonella enterica subsp. enterica serovar Minnesota]|uniref:CapA family protein n=1 Tax=Salmonella enterica TaxID=28901 RepID=UPI003D2A03DD